MGKLQLDVFLAAGHDFEQAQYRVLAGLKHTRRAFSQNVIYPHLREMIELHNTLNTIDQRLEDVENAMPGEVRAIDLGAKTIVYEKPGMGPEELEDLRELVRWALPHVQSTIEEGRAVFEFVDENLHLEEVGIVPSYLQEGYLILPVRERKQMHVLRYSLSIFSKAGERYRSLRTSQVKSMPQGAVYPSPQAVKLDLVAEHKELPNPATYFFATKLDFPFEATMLPVAKRKLMRYLSEEGRA